MQRQCNSPPTMNTVQYEHNLLLSVLFPPVFSSETDTPIFPMYFLEEVNVSIKGLSPS